MSEQLYHNKDGLLQRFGRSQGRRKNTTSGAGRLGATNCDGEIQEVELQVDLAGSARTLFTADRNNDGTMDGFEKGLDSFIPSGAKPIAVYSIPIVTPAGGTSWQVGAFQVDGSAIDDDGLTAAGGSAAAQGADGALINTVLAQDSYVTVKTVGTYTAGKLKIIIRYLLPATSLKP